VHDDYIDELEQELQKYKTAENNYITHLESKVKELNKVI